MENYTRLLALLVFFLATHLLSAQQQLPDHHAVNHVIERPAVPDLDRQAELLARNAWGEFKEDQPTWNVEFNESSGKPHRAFGAPIFISGDLPEERALNFIEEKLQGFGIPINELVHSSTMPTSRNTFVHFTQVHQGIPVIKGHLMVKFDQQQRVIAFGAEVHDDIMLDIQPVITPSMSMDIAAAGIPGVTSVEFEGMRILPVPAERSMDHRLVNEITVHAASGNRPSQYQCWVDAHTGKLWYRWDKVQQCGHKGHGDSDLPKSVGADVQVDATVYESNTLNPTIIAGLPDLRVSVNGNFLYTDENGFLPTGITGPVNTQIQLRGRWSNVNTGGVTPSFNATLGEGTNYVSFDGSANIRERSAYHFVNKVHAQVNSVLPAFQGMDIALPTNVDVTGGDCNAFYDGSSINFYAQGGGCYSLATVGDVVYHEYGHGINDKYYQSQGSNFVNGAMNEGYADVWALSITKAPVIAQGYMMADQNSYIRRYDQDPKVYPIDLVGQVHADGEIICGAWWDTYLLLGEDMDLTMELFAGAFPGLQANAFNGQEGQAYRDVLIDVLQADDDDGDITNGTPNGMAIVQGFALHGITLLSNVQLQHTAIEASTGEEEIPVQANVSITFPYNTYLNGVRTFYRINASQQWESVLMTNTGGSLYSATIPAQPEGTVIAYYLALEDIFGQTSSVLPIGAAAADPNLPYFILVGAALHATDDADVLHQFGPWFAGISSDNATTGMWEWTEPIGSFATPGDMSTMVQPNHQHTSGGVFCWVTGNADTEEMPLGTSDVDGGTTTLLSSLIDMTPYEEPIFTYWRWYVNNPPSGANPNADWWQTFISNDGGDNWVPVEETKTSDRSWRRMAFRVSDYVVPTSMMKFKFNASDSIRPGQYLDGGSLVEAAVDDIQLWDLAGTIGITEEVDRIDLIYPDPVSDELNILLNGSDQENVQLEVMDLTGKIVLQANSERTYPIRLDVRSLAEGSYILRVIGTRGHGERRFTVIR